jgi:putative transposase
MLRDRLNTYRIALLNYCITSNHTHLLLRPRDGATESLSLFMQSLEGDFAQYYNLRKGRFGAFWWDRYHAVMIQDGLHLRRCMVYIDLNMVRAGVVKHPAEWEWTGYQELMGLRRRNRLLDREMLCRCLEYDRSDDGFAALRRKHKELVADTLARRDLQRRPYWTESIAVGEEDWIRSLGATIRNRMKVVVEENPAEAGQWVVKEPRPAYGAMDRFSGPKTGP